MSTWASRVPVLPMGPAFDAMLLSGAKAARSAAEKQDARLTFTMVHNWSEELAVRPRSAVRVAAGGYFASNSIALRPARTVQTYPSVRLGARATAKLTNVLYAHPGSKLDVGGRVILEGEDATAEVISRAVTAGGSVVARGHLVGKVRGVRAHLECSALILDERGHVKAIPELEAAHPDVDMTHEAAVGKVAPEEIDYLRARGLRARPKITDPVSSPLHPG